METTPDQLQDWAGIPSRIRVWGDCWQYGMYPSDFYMPAS
jgi:hypothetical protein